MKKFFKIAACIALVAAAVFAFIFHNGDAGGLSVGAYVGATKMGDGETGIQVISSERERAVYEHNSSQARFSGKNMTPGFLRLEQEIVNSKNIFSFTTFAGDAASVYPTERRLDRNDAFIATEVGLFILRQDIANGKTNADLHCYVNLTTFVAAAGFVPADLKAIFHGHLSIEIGRVKKMVAFDTQRFWNAPETQQTGATNYDQKNGRKDGFVRLTPQIVIDGAGTNDLSVTFPSYTGWTGASVTAGTQHRLCLYLRGLLVTGGSANS